MTISSRFLLPVMASVAAVVAAGCGHDDYRADTELRSDGTVARAILQPVSHMPDAAHKPDRWTKLFHVAPEKDRPLDVPIRELTPNRVGDVSGPVAAWGEFRTAAEIPEQIRWETPDKTGVGHLEREAERRDFVFVVEHVWSETLTDIVTVDDFRKARVELTDLAVHVLEETLREELGPDVDLSRLIEFLRDDARRFVETVAERYLLQRSAKPRRGEEAFQRGISDECRRFGFDPDVGGDFEGFVAEKIRKTVRGRTGAPLDDETIGAIVTWLFHRNTLGEDPPKRADRFEAALQRVIERRYGGEEAFQRRIGSLFSRLVGVYGLFAGRERFRYTLTMPGPIVETNGVLVDDNEVLWTFTAADAYPTGYEMRARSVERNAAALKAAGIDDAKLRSRRDLVDCAAILDKNRSIHDTLRECVATKSLAPLENHRKIVDQDGNAEYKATMKRFARLVGLK